MSEYCFGEKRNKSKFKRKERKKHPYKKGGVFRSSEISLKKKK